MNSLMKMTLKELKSYVKGIGKSLVDDMNNNIFVAFEHCKLMNLAIWEPKSYPKECIRLEYEAERKVETQEELRARKLEEQHNLARMLNGF